jgi:ribosomal 50S subunit-recycling heat shock protein
MKERLRSRWRDTAVTTRVLRCEMYLSVSRLDKRRALANSTRREFVNRLSAS